MKIERLHIAHFGKFSDYTLAFEDGFSVFYGITRTGNPPFWNACGCCFTVPRGGEATLPKTPG